MGWEGTEGGTPCFRKVNLSRVRQARSDNGFLETEENMNEHKWNELHEGDAPNYLGKNLRAHITIQHSFAHRVVVGGKRTREHNVRETEDAAWLSLGGKKETAIGESQTNKNIARTALTHWKKKET